MRERPEFNSTLISPSRVDKYLACGVQFRRKYIDGEPEQRSGSAALFGSVVHRALETWALDRSTDLVPLMAAAWQDVTGGTIVQDFIAAYQHISISVMKAEREAVVSFEKRNPGKKSQAPRMTKEFKASPAAQALNVLVAQWFDRLTKESPWRFTERDPLPKLYDESLVLAKKYAEKWRGLPAALYPEFEFNVEWQGFFLRGYIDNIEPLLTDDGELYAIQVVDYKTYAKDPPEQKDWRQGVIYDIAVDDLRKRGVLDLPRVPVYVTFDYCRLLERRDFLYTILDRGKLYDELRMYKAGVDAGVYLPATKSANPLFCDYPDDCCLVSKGESLGKRGTIYSEAA